MKNRFAALVLTVFMLIPLMTSAFHTSATSPLNYDTEMETIRLYCPNARKTLTRDYTAYLLTYYYSPEKSVSNEYTEQVFSDVPATDPFFPSINFCYGRSMLEGTDFMTFRPNDTISFQELCEGLYKVALYIGAPAYADTTYPAELTDISDATSADRKDAIAFAYTNGLIIPDSDGKVYPLNEVKIEYFIYMLIKFQPIMKAYKNLENDCRHLCIINNDQDFDYCSLNGTAYINGTCALCGKQNRSLLVRNNGSHTIDGWVTDIPATTEHGGSMHADCYICGRVTRDTEPLAQEITTTPAVTSQRAMLYSRSGCYLPGEACLTVNNDTSQISPLETRNIESFAPAGKAVAGVFNASLTVANETYTPEEPTTMKLLIPEEVKNNFDNISVIVEVGVGKYDDVESQVNGDYVEFPVTSFGRFVLVGRDAWVCPFIDVTEGSWYFNNVKYCARLGYMAGTNSIGTLFSPSQNLTRAMFVRILASLDGADLEPFSGVPSFNDVPACHWFSASVMWAATNSIVSGRTVELFDPYGNVSRQEMIVMMYRYAEYKSINTNVDMDNMLSIMFTYSDYTELATWSQNAVIWAIDRGIVSGKGGDFIAPNDFATRAEVATIIRAFCLATGY